MPFLPLLPFQQGYKLLIPHLVPAPIISGLSMALCVGPTNLSAVGMTAGVKFSSIRLLVIACSPGLAQQQKRPFTLSKTSKSKKL